MPRRSAEARATAAAVQAGRLPPSPHLAAAEKRAWRAVVDATPAGHLTERDRPLLDSYVSLTCAARALAGIVGKAKASDLADTKTPAGMALHRAESIGKSLAALSNRLKLAPLATKAEPDREGIRSENPSAPPLLGGIRRVV